MRANLPEVVVTPARAKKMIDSIGVNHRPQEQIDRLKKELSVLIEVHTAKPENPDDKPVKSEFELQGRSNWAEYLKLQKQADVLETLQNTNAAEFTPEKQQELSTIKSQLDTLLENEYVDIKRQIKTISVDKKRFKKEVKYTVAVMYDALIIDIISSLVQKVKRDNVKTVKPDHMSCITRTPLGSLTQHLDIMKKVQQFGTEKKSYADELRIHMDRKKGYPLGSEEHDVEKDHIDRVKKYRKPAFYKDEGDKHPNVKEVRSFVLSLKKRVLQDYKESSTREEDKKFYSNVRFAKEMYPIISEFVLQFNDKLVQLISLYMSHDEHKTVQPKTVTLILSSMLVEHGHSYDELIDLLKSRSLRLMQQQKTKVDDDEETEVEDDESVTEEL